MLETGKDPVGLRAFYRDLLRKQPAMNPLTRKIPILATVLEAYYDLSELGETAAAFGVNLQFGYDDSERKTQWFRVAKQIIDNVDQGTNYVLITELIDQLDAKNSIAIAQTTYERRQANEALAPRIHELREALRNVASPSAITVPDASPFTAKADIRAMLATATTEILVVDPYVGIGTLDCFIGVTQPIRLLTGDKPNSIDSSFAKGLADFRAEGNVIEVRRGVMLHDRHFVFNGRCWLLGSSLKDAGKKAFNCLEVIDNRVIIADLESKWTNGMPVR
jgi:hypothetical protein